jgi:cysteine desulfurase
MALKEIYLDNSATTRPSLAVVDKMSKVSRENFGNPSSLHAKGFEAEKIILKSKESISGFLGCDPEELYFTSGGTEANNLAILGSVNAKRRLGNKIVTTAVEHDSVIAPCKELEKLGFEVIYLKPDSSGCINIKKFADVIDSKTILVSVMMINNETGFSLPVKKIKEVININNSPALYHIDAVQAFGKIPVKVRPLGADLISITAHKIHGPKCIGALFCSKNIKINPIIFGGEQQKRLRPGTLSPPLIAGFSTAAEESINLQDESAKKVENLRQRCIELLLKIPQVKINNIHSSFPYIINLSVSNIKSETMMHYLSSNGIYVSSGSACSHGKKSHVLKAMNLSDDIIDSAIRVSFSRYNTIEDVEKLVFTLKSGISDLCTKF